MADTFFLTGCASGIGRHMADALQRRGDRVFATDVNHEALEATARDLGWPEERVRIHALDVTDYGAWEQVFAEAVSAFGGIDVCMNIAGLLLASWAEESPVGEIDSQIDVNVKGVMYGTRVASAHMVQRGHGHIVNISSIASMTPVPGMAIYSASKYAVRAYSLSAAMELRAKGVYVTAVCPSTIQTPMLDNQEENPAAEMFFAGLKILTLDEIEDAILHRALRRKPYLVEIPRWRNWFVRLGDLFPTLSVLLSPLYKRSGRKRQEQRRGE